MNRPADDDVLEEEEFDPDFVPTPEQMQYHAINNLGVDPEVEPRVLDIAKQALMTPLPEHWRPCKTKTGEIYYYNFIEDISIGSHPIDKYFRFLAGVLVSGRSTRPLNFNDWEALGGPKDMIAIDNDGYFHRADERDRRTARQQRKTLAQERLSLVDSILSLESERTKMEEIVRARLANMSDFSCSTPQENTPGLAATAMALEEFPVWAARSAVLQARRDELRAELGAIAPELKKMRARMRKWNAQAQHHKEEADRLRNEFLARQNASKEGQEVIKEMREFVDQLHAREQEEKDAEARAADAARQIAESSAGVPEEISRLKTEIDELTKKHQTEIQQSNKIASEIRRLQGKVLCFCAVTDSGDAVRLPDEFTVEVGASDAEPALFTLDRAFAHGTAPAEVAEECRDLAEAVTDGYNCALVGFGAPDSGFEKLLFGAVGSDGVAQYMCEHLHTAMVADPTTRYGASVSAFMSLDGSLFDLFADSPVALERVVKNSQGIVHVDGANVRHAPDQEALVAAMRAAKDAFDARRGGPAGSLFLSICLHGRTSAEAMKLGRLLVALLGPHTFPAPPAEPFEPERAADGPAAARDAALLSVVRALRDATPQTAVPYTQGPETLFLSDVFGGNCKAVVVSALSARAEALPRSLATAAVLREMREVQNKPLLDVKNKIMMKIEAQVVKLGGEALLAACRPVADRLQRSVEDETGDE
eukprot:gnl/Chilomastix_cuspidata/723.p1 GENE.gnl/Chilomastix_cuspidata/723~~gnl/Chilomastix_cuspidata/723.p1  ORF type:complete len:707 (+),score=308.52 gnl/Chilomastix_cuspidata/723:40-2160(+)